MTTARDTAANMTSHTYTAVSTIINAVELIAKFQRHLDEMRADKRTDTILAWDYSMGVRLTDGRAGVCSILQATSITTDGLTPKQARAYPGALAMTITNGQGVSPLPMARNVALARAIASQEQTILMMKNLMSNLLEMAEAA